MTLTIYFLFVKIKTIFEKGNLKFISRGKIEENPLIFEKTKSLKMKDLKLFLLYQKI